MSTHAYSCSAFDGWEHVISGWGRDGSEDHRRVIMYRHTLFYSASLYCTSQILNIFKTEGLKQPSIKQGYRIIVSTAFAHFMSLCHILVILMIFQDFSILLYL